ncbi:PAS domain S-box protein [Algoriphagus sp. AK58]|uniref:PAS domain S-box protein n=1 Tax=Algoriphagus sp. AK58 TaxID=1406877 RepID=UPI00164F5D19|nr:PAS domain S-box protein [Algoriphagus sp. AK58]MBC6365321.1 hybrid sensor histidine kinase/response regulator [Algoriphagus sp. AK58]
MNQFQQFDISDFLNEIQEPLFLMDSEEIIFFNHYFQNHFQLIGERWREFLNHEDLQTELGRFFSSGELPKSRFIKSLTGHSGQKVPFEWVFINLPSSYTERFLIVKGNKINSEIQDIPEVLLKPEGAITEELRYMQSILNNSHDLIAIFDRDGNYRYVSKSVEQKIGIPVAQLLGRNYREFVESGVFEIVKGSFEEILHTKQEVALDFWINRSTGSRIYLESFAKNLLDHPQIQGILFSSRDITDFILTSQSLQRRYEIENLINLISAQLINGKWSNLEDEFDKTLIQLGKMLGAEGSKILIFNRDTKELEILNSWSKVSDTSSFFEYGARYFSLINSIRKDLEKGKVKQVHIPVRSIKGNEYRTELQLLIIPLISSHKLLGIIQFEFESGRFSYSEKEIQVFKQLGDILAGAYLGSQMMSRLQRNENLLANTELLANSGSWRFGAHQNRFHFSGGLSRLLGMGDQPILADFTSLIYKIDKSHRADFIRNLRQASSQLVRTSGEFTITDAEHKTRFISYEIEGKKDFLSQGLEIFGFCTDITHKRATDGYLRLQSQILAQVSDPIIVTNLSLEVIYLNESAIQLCSPETARGFRGYLEELLTVSWKNNENLKEIADRMDLGQVWKSEQFIQTRHTPFSPFEVTLQPIQAEEEEKIGYSLILHSLEQKYRSEQIARRAKLIVENSPVILFRVDPSDQYRIKYISENISRFGYDASHLIQNETPFLDLVHPEDRALILDLARKQTVKEGIRSFSGEYRIRKTDGTFVWVEDRTSDVENEEGHIILHEGLFQDITDRKRLEIIQKERDKQYRILASNIPRTNIFLLDSQRRYILAEGTNFEFWGLKREDFEGKHLRDFYLTPFEEVNQILDRVFFDQEIVESEFSINGRRYHRVIRPIIENERVEYALSIIRDVEDEYRAKQDLINSEEKYRRLVEESTEIIFSLTETFLINYVSPNVKQFLDYDSEEVIGRSIFDFLNPDDLDQFRIMLNEKKDILSTTQFLEFRLRHKDGTYRVFSSNGRLIFDRDGTHRYYTGVARDISKLKEAEQELRIAKEKAEQASLVKSQFLSVMSHEIRTPMNAVIGLAHFLMEENPRPDQLENLKTLQFSAENLMALINDILDFNKIDSGKVELEKAPFDVRNVVHRIVHSHSFQANEKNLRLSCEIDEAIPETLIGDSLRLGQIVNNLVSNAVKFTDRGFVRISLFREYTANGLTEIRFLFEDSGIGIPDQKKKSIFEAFTQASSSTSRKYGGTGLGLAIVKRLVELHGGEIELHDRKGGGSVFEFILPFEFIDQKALEAEKAAQTISKSLEKASILVAEDNIVNQILIRKFLTKWNAGNLVIAGDGKEALDLFGQQDFDLVLLDLQMPELDGFEVALKIRENQSVQKANVPILALTAASYNEVKDELMKAGIDDFIPKPFSPEILYEKIIKVLNPKDPGEILV